MTYVLLAGAILAFLIYLGRRRRGYQWRPVGAVLSICALTIGATLLALKVFVPAVALIGLAALLALGARARPTGAPPQPQTPQPYADMSLSEACAVLGVGPDATKDEIQAAYRRLIAVNHPDKGGTPGLAAQLNAARDKLLR